MLRNLSRRSLLAAAPLGIGEAPTPAQAGNRAGSPALFDARSYGASGDGRTVNTLPLQRALDACSAAGGGTVYIPAGVFLTGPIRMGAHTTLWLEGGAVLQGSPRLGDYETEPDPVSGESSRAGLVTARNADDVAIAGRGTIDGNAMAFHDQTRLHAGSDYDKRYTRQKEDFRNPKYGIQDGPIAHGERPGNAVRFIQCRNVQISGVTIQNSPTWTTLIHKCRDVSISGVHINSLASGRRVPNDDGIDVRDSQYVRITGCHIEVGDDCIALFGSSNVVAGDCTLVSRSAGIRVGYAEGDVRDCVFQNLTIDSNCGLKVNVRSSGSVENVRFSEIVMRTRLFTGHWWGKGEPVNVSAVPGLPGAAGLGSIRGVSFANISAESESGIVLYGCEQSPLRDVSFDNVRLRLRNSELQSSYGGNFDVRTNLDLSHALFEHDVPGCFFTHVDGLKIREFELRWPDDPPPFFSHGIWGDHFRNVEIRGFEGRQARAGSGQAVIAVSDGSGLTIRECSPQPGAGPLLAAQRVTDQRVFSDDNAAPTR